MSALPVKEQLAEKLGQTGVIPQSDLDAASEFFYDFILLLGKHKGFRLGNLSTMGTVIDKIPLSLIVEILNQASVEQAFKMES